MQSNHKLILCGLIQDENYFNEKIAPYLNDTSIIYQGNVGPEQRNQLMGQAKALLHPISFDEPFGLSVAEAMMCGTPVIAFDRGSMNELIINRKTGFLVHTAEEAIAATGKINKISRPQCREHAMSKFTSDVMAEHYIQLYNKIARAAGGL